MKCWRWVLLLFAATASLNVQSAPSTCPLVDGSGCCSLQCQIGLCSALYSFGKAMGAHNTTGDLVWSNRSGWEQLYSSSSSSSSSGLSERQAAQVACSAVQQQRLKQAGAAAAGTPLACDLFGVSCEAGVFSQSCPAGSSSRGVSSIELINNNLSGNISSSTFMSSLQLLHDCGLRKLVLGGSDFEVRGQLGPEWGRLSQLQGLGLFTLNITGTVPAEIGNLTDLEFLDLSGNYLTGTLPETLGQLTKLQVLMLPKNGFTDLGLELGGSLPQSITRLQKLEVLNLESNAFRGTLPPLMCSRMRNLRAISLRDNHFTGPITQFALCHLLSLDLSSNMFTGKLPVPVSTARGVDGPWLHLKNLGLADNQLTGHLPEFPYGAAPILSVVNIANNRISGSFPHSWTTLPWLSQVDASYNNLSGEVPYELAFQSMLTSLRLHSNTHIGGGISPWFRLTVSLQTLTLHNTSVTGTVPGITRAKFLRPGFDNSTLCGGQGAGLGRLPALQLVTITDTRMTALCNSSEADCDDINEYLPWYLAVEENMLEVPLPEPGFHANKNMKCPRVHQVLFCRHNQAPEGFAKGMRPSWYINPSYYHYKGCQCSSGHVPSYNTKMLNGIEVRALVCTYAPSKLTPAQAIALTVTISTCAVVFMAYCAYVSWYGRLGLPKLHRAVADLQKRHMGAPTSGKVSFVVTDIESYSALMVAMPLAMGQALSQHSNVIRRAAWSHYGNVVGQEGDSFILAFRDGLDAVAFCLQVQQGLTKVPWPLELLQHQQKQDLATVAPALRQLHDLSVSSPSAPHAAALLSSSSVVSGEGPGRMQQPPLPTSSSAQQLVSASHSSKSRYATWRSPGSGTAGHSSPLFEEDVTHLGTPLVPVPAEQERRSSLLQQLAQRSITNRGWWQQQQQQQPHAATGSSSPAAYQEGSPTGRHHYFGASSSSQEFAAGSPTNGSYSEPAHNALVGGPRQFVGDAIPHQPSFSAADLQRHSLPVQQQCLVAPISVLIPGLRVRMGVTSGVLGEQEDCLNSRVLEAARVVSDAGSGGQVLLDSVTFGLIKHRLEELGQVGSSGYIKSSRVTGWGAPQGWLARLLRHHVQLASDAVVLDMGLYSVPGCSIQQGLDHKALLPDLSAPVQPPPGAASTRANNPEELETSPERPTMHETPTKTAAAAIPRARAAPAATPAPAAAVSTTINQAAKSNVSGCVRLYQILAPKCMERALLFGNTLALKQGSRCHDLPYFCAPAAASKSLLDMLMVDTHISSAAGTSRTASSSSAGAKRSRAGSSRVMLRRKYRFPLNSSKVASGAGLEAAHSSSPWRSPLAAALSSMPSLPLTKAYSQPKHHSPEGSTHLQSLSTQPPRQLLPTIHQSHKQQSQPQPQQSLQIITSSSTCRLELAAVSAEGAADSTRDGSVKSSAASNSTPWPVVSIPITAVAPVRSNSSTDGGAAATSFAGATFVFASAALHKATWVEGVHMLQMTSMIKALVRQTLLASAAAAADNSSSTLSMGYLVRESPAEMKYLLAFHSPRAALEWCLTLQEALIWQDWPAAVTSGGKPTLAAAAAAEAAVGASEHAQQAAKLHPAAGSSHPDHAVINTEATESTANGKAPEAAAGMAGASRGGPLGRLPLGSNQLLSGPRMKMGVCCGAPQSVTPDYMGRVDYHGHAVNMAARYESVCAQPGQIVCDVQLAQMVLAEWAAAAAAEQQQPQLLQVEQHHAAAPAAGSESTNSLASSQYQQHPKQTALQAASPFHAASQQQSTEALQHQQHAVLPPLDGVLPASAAAAASHSAANTSQLTTPAPEAMPAAGEATSFLVTANDEFVLSPEPSLTLAGSAAVCMQPPSKGSPAASVCDTRSPVFGAAAANNGSDAAWHNQENADAAADEVRRPGGFPSFCQSLAPGQASLPLKSPFAAAPHNHPTASTFNLPAPPAQAATPDGLKPSPSPAAATAAFAVIEGQPVHQGVALTPAQSSLDAGGAVVGSAPAATAAGPCQPHLPSRAATTDLSTAAGFAAAKHGMRNSNSSGVLSPGNCQQRSSTWDPAGWIDKGGAGTGWMAGPRGQDSSLKGGVAGLGGGLGMYGGTSSRRLQPALSHTPSWSHQHGAYHQQQQQQQQWSKSTSRSHLSQLSAPQVCPLQPPTAVLPCPVAAPSDLPACLVSVEAHRLGRFKFKGSSTPVPMVELVASHHVQHRQMPMDPTPVPSGPKGGLVEAQQGLVTAVQGVQLSGILHTYHQTFQAKAAAAAAAAALPPVEGRKGGRMQRFLRASLQPQDVSQGCGKADVRAPGSNSSVTAPTALARLGSVLTRTLSQATGSLSAARNSSKGSFASRQSSRAGGPGVVADSAAASVAAVGHQSSRAAAAG